MFKCLIFKENVFGINWMYILSDQMTLKVTFYFVLVLQNYMEAAKMFLNVSKYCG